MHVPSGSHEGDSCIRIGFGRLYVVGDRPGEPGVIVHVKYISGISVVVIESIYSGSGIRLVVIVSIDDLSLAQVRTWEPQEVKIQKVYQRLSSTEQAAPSFFVIRSLK